MRENLKSLLPWYWMRLHVGQDTGAWRSYLLVPVSWAFIKVRVPAFMVKQPEWDARNTPQKRSK